MSPRAVEHFPVVATLTPTLTVRLRDRVRRYDDATYFHGEAIAAAAPRWRILHHGARWVGLLEEADATPHATMHGSRTLSRSAP